MTGNCTRMQCRVTLLQQAPLCCTCCNRLRMACARCHAAHLGQIVLRRTVRLQRGAVQQLVHLPRSVRRHRLPRRPAALRLQARRRRLLFLATRGRMARASSTSARAREEGRFGADLNVSIRPDFEAGLGRRVAQQVFDRLRVRVLIADHLQTRELTTEREGKSLCAISSDRVHVAA